MSRKSKLHLPDCEAVQSTFTKDCDCETPRHPLPTNQMLVKVKKRGSKKRRLAVVSTSKRRKK